MTASPLVSIVLPILNGARFLEQSLKSCLTQTHSHLELIAVDGGSTDGTLDLLADCGDERLRIVHQARGDGRLPTALNIGFRESVGEYLTWTHDDNWYEPEAIERMAGILEEQPEVGFVYTDYRKVDTDGRFLSRFRASAPEALPDGNCVGHCFLYRRTVMEAVGEYDEEYYTAEDYEYWLRVSLRFRMVVLPEPLYSYRSHDGSLTETRGVEHLQRAVERARARWLGPDPYRWPSRYARGVAQVHLDRAYEAHVDGRWRDRRSGLLRALREDPRRLADRGVRSLLIRTVARGLSGSEERS